jgi:type I restriction enzyme S subunit
MNGLLLTRYLFHFLRGPQFQAIAHERITGSAVPHLFQRDIKKLRAVVPPLAEQQRIVAKLDALLGKIGVCRNRLAKIPVLLKRLRQSILAAACSGRLTADWRERNEPAGGVGDSGEIAEGFPLLPGTWHWQPLGAVCERIVDCPHSTPKWTSSGRLCIRTTNFKPGLLDLSEVRYVSEQAFKKRIERLRPRPGDILYSREGGILGIACVIPPGVELCLGQRMMLFRARSDFTGALLMHWLNSPAILRRVHELTGGSASPHLNVRDIKAFPTPVPPFTEQHEIVSRVESLLGLADQIESRFEKARTQVDKLPFSLLAKAFHGELVPTEAELARREVRDYEDGLTLLERLSTRGVGVGRSRSRPAPKRGPRPRGQAPRTRKLRKPQ